MSLASQRSYTAMQLNHHTIFTHAEYKNIGENLSLSSKNLFLQIYIREEKCQKFTFNLFALWIVKFCCIVSWPCFAYQEILVMVIQVSCQLKNKITKQSWHLTGLSLAREELQKCKKLKGWTLYFFHINFIRH